MAYREVDMWEILNVLRRLGRGESQATVARHTEHCRKTIRRYVTTAAELGWSPGGEEPTEELAATIYRRLRPSGDGSPGEVEQRLLPHREQIREWLKAPPGKKRGLQLTKVHGLLRRRSGVDVPYSSLHRFAIKHCGFRERRRVTLRRAECDPGELAEVDFGKLGLIPHPETGRRRTAWALVVVLPSSRHQYVHITHSQKFPDLISGLEDAWIFFGGVSQRVVLDNLKAAVTKADLYNPIFARSFEDYARYRGFVIDAAASRHPTGKPVAERGVPYVRENLFRGEDWRHIEHLQNHATRWCLETAGTRIHGTTRQRPLDVFEEIERDPAPAPHAGALRPPVLGPVQGPPRPPHQLRQGTVFRAHPLHRQVRMGRGEQQDRARLRGRRAHQDPSQASPGRARHRLRRLPERAHLLRATRPQTPDPSC